MTSRVIPEPSRRGHWDSIRTGRLVVGVQPDPVDRSLGIVAVLLRADLKHVAPDAVFLHGFVEAVRPVDQARQEEQVQHGVHG